MRKNQPQKEVTKKPLFEQLSVKELEDRLELAAGRCICRNA